MIEAASDVFLKFNKTEYLPNFFKAGLEMLQNIY